MTTFLTIEINNFLSEYVRSHPITGNINLDQKLVIISVSFLSMYITGFLDTIKYTIMKWWKPNNTYFDRQNDNIAHIQITDPNDLYNYLENFEKLLPENTSIANKFNKKRHNDNKISFSINSSGNDPNKPCAFSTKPAQLPFEEDLEIETDIKNLKRTRYVIYKDYSIMIAVFFHKKEGLHYYHLFIEKKMHDTIETIYNIISQFICDAKKNYNKTKTKKQFDDFVLYEIRNGKWKDIEILPAKDNINIVGQTCRDIFNDVKLFQTELIKTYTKLDIPYKRGYCFYGPPGCGKTSIIKSIASYTKKSIYKLTFNEDGLGDDEYKILLSQTPINSIILIEDIDPRLLGEGGFIEKSSTINNNNNNTTTTTIKIVRVSYNTLLDALDGINSNTGRITFITTNHPDRIGDALFRPGRIDEEFILNYTTNDDIKEYFQLFYGIYNIDTTIINKASDSFISTCRNNKEGNKITFAELQQFLMRYLNNIDKMLANVSTFKNDTKKQQRKQKFV